MEADPSPSPPSLKRHKPENLTIKVYRLYTGVGDDGTTPKWASLVQIQEYENTPNVQEYVDVSLEKESQQRSTSHTKATQSYYNIVMVDTSASMHFGRVRDNWNANIAPHLTGKTEIYTFSKVVKFRRVGTLLFAVDNDFSSTNLTMALAKIRSKIDACGDENIRVFLVTDGHDNRGGDPKREIDLMQTPDGKTVEVYVLGIGEDFPVSYSVDIRSKLHNGSAICPTLFWSRNYFELDEVTRQMCDAMRSTDKNRKINLSLPAKDMPFSETTKSVASIGEFLYYANDPENLVAELTLTCGDDGTVIRLTEDSIEDVPPTLLVREVFKQWTAVLLQRHRKRMSVPMAAFDLMEVAFESSLKKTIALLGGERPNNVRARMALKLTKTLPHEYATLVNQSKKLIGIEDRFKNEMEFAEALLSTTVQSRYDTKLLAMRGYTDCAWRNDVEKFKQQYLTIRDEIRRAGEPDEEDRCRVLFSSFIDDLRDDGFLDLLNDGKINFLTNMTFTGIPILAPLKDSAQINAWTLYIQDICTSPFEILSQRSLAGSSALMEDRKFLSSSSAKEVTLQHENPNSTFNAIVPIIPKKYCQLVKPLVLSNVFSVGATYCILKNALINDPNCHLAALACIWMKSIRDFPKTSSRPEYIRRRIEHVVATSLLYTDRNSIVEYVKAMRDFPEQALMTESTEKFFDGQRRLKCESLIKPAFLLYLFKDSVFKSEHFGEERLISLIRLILVEFLKRCLKFNTSETPYLDFLQKPPETAGEKKNQLHNLTRIVLSSGSCVDTTTTTAAAAAVDGHFKKLFDGKNLLERYYTPAEVSAHIRGHWGPIIDKTLTDKNSGLIGNPTPNMNAINKLTNYSSAGDLTWLGLRAWVHEVFPSSSSSSSSPPPSLCEHNIAVNVCSEEGSGSFCDDVKAGDDRDDDGTTSSSQSRLATAAATEWLFFSPEMVCSYMAYALWARKPKGRVLTVKSLMDEDTTRQFIIQRQRDEFSFGKHKAICLQEIEEMALESWRMEYYKTHSYLALPLTPEMIIRKASARGIEVDESNFHSRYKYREDTRLCTNCCQIEQCPHFLVPNKICNQHLEVSRKKCGPFQVSFFHALHKVVANHHQEDTIYTITDLVASGAKGKKGNMYYKDILLIARFAQQLCKAYKKLDTPAIRGVCV